MNIYITAKLAKKLNLIVNPKSENQEYDLFDWHAHIFEYAGNTGIIFTNNKTKYSVKIYKINPEDYPQIDNIILKVFRRVMTLNGFFTQEINYLLSSKIKYYKEQNRKIIKYNNDKISFINRQNKIYDSHLYGMIESSVNDNFQMNHTSRVSIKEMFKQLNQVFVKSRLERFEDCDIEEKIQLEEISYNYLEKGYDYERNGYKHQALQQFKNALHVNPFETDAKLEILKINFKGNELIDELENLALEELKYLEKKHGITIENSKGSFYGITETRPYMRILQNQMFVHIKQTKNYQAAAKICLKLMELSKSDNMGIRFIYTVVLAYAAQKEELNNWMTQNQYGISSRLMYELIVAVNTNDKQLANKIFSKNNRFIREISNCSIKEINIKYPEVIEEFKMFDEKLNELLKIQQMYQEYKKST